MKRSLYFLLLCCILISSGCKSRGTLLPSISGKAGEILLVIEKQDLDGALGQTLRESLEDEYPYLPLVEPSYTLINTTHSGFIEMFQVHRNIIFFDINPQIQTPGVTVVRDRWAAPQIVVNIAAHSSEDAIALYKENEKLIITSIEQAERDRIVRNSLRYENKDVSAQVFPVFGGSVRVPSGFVLRKISHDFAWIEYSTRNYSEGIFIYRYPAGKDALSGKTIIEQRDKALEENVPGPDEGSYMKTASYWTPTTEYIKYKGREFAQTHGQWDLEGAFMGGPFVLHSFYSQDGSEIIVLDAWVYAPKTNKRQLLRKAESILYTWTWKKEDGKGE